MQYNFYALLSRMKYIERWSLMRSARKENILEHSADVALLSQALAIINNVVFGGNTDINIVASLALYHDISEVITGDMATPVKYFNNEIMGAYKSMENMAEEKLKSMLPEAFQPIYDGFMSPDEDSYEFKLVKAADKLSAYIKCLEEESTGNKEFSVAKKSIKKVLDDMPYPEVKYFIDNFLDGYGKPLDVL